MVKLCSPEDLVKQRKVAKKMLDKSLSDSIQRCYLTEFEYQEQTMECVAILAQFVTLEDEILGEIRYRESLHETDFNWLMSYNF